MLRDISLLDTLVCFTFLTGFTVKTSETLANARSDAQASVHTSGLTDG